MATALSVEAQEFVPFSDEAKEETSRTRLSVDAAVFVPTSYTRKYIDKQSQEEPLVPVIEKKERTYSNVKRRGRFPGKDTRQNAENVDMPSDTNSRGTKKEYSRLSREVPPNVDVSLDTNSRGTKNEYPRVSREVAPNVDLSLDANSRVTKKEYPRLSREVVPNVDMSSDANSRATKKEYSRLSREVPPNVDMPSDANNRRTKNEYSRHSREVPPNVDPPSDANSRGTKKEYSRLSREVPPNEPQMPEEGKKFQPSCDSRESKPIVLWSSIVKKPPEIGKLEEKHVTENSKTNKQFSKGKTKKNMSPRNSDNASLKKKNLRQSDGLRKNLRKEDTVLDETMVVRHASLDKMDGDESLINKKQKSGVSKSHIFSTKDKSNSINRDLKCSTDGKDRTTATHGDANNKHNFISAAKHPNGQTQKTNEKMSFSKKVLENKNKSRDVAKRSKLNGNNESSSILAKYYVRTLKNTRNTSKDEKKLRIDNCEVTKLSPEGNSVEKVEVPEPSCFPALTNQVLPSVTPVLSYSAVAKIVMPKKADPRLRKEDKMATSIISDTMTEAEKIAIRKREKVLKRKMKKKIKKNEAQLEKQPQALPLAVQSRTEQELTFDLSDMFSQLLKKSSTAQKSAKSTKGKKVKMSSGVISVVSGLAKKNTPDGKRVEKNKYGTTHTIMDGTTPIQKRGKERETPKRKKPTMLKKIISAERKRKQEMLEKKGNSNTEEINEKMNADDIGVDTENYSEKCYNMNKFPEEIWRKLHSKKFREYCDQVITKDINNLTYNLLITLQRFQDRVFHETPMKFKQKRRFILGLREVLKHLKLKKLKAVVIAPNLERISSKGGLDDYLGSIISKCNEMEIPKIYAMNRHVLGRIIKKNAPVSVVGIFDYDGAQDTFKELISHVESAKLEYMDKIYSLTEKRTNISDESDEDLKEINEERTRNEEEEQLKQVILNKLMVEERPSYDVESESDAWVTDND